MLRWPGEGRAGVEYATDSTRTIASLLFSGTASRAKDIRFVFSHGGGTAPFLVGRFERLADEKKNVPNGVRPELGKFYYEIAQADHLGALAALMDLVPISQVLFGSDYPLRPISEAVQGVAKYNFSDAERRALENGNASRLLARLKKVSQ